MLSKWSIVCLAVLTVVGGSTVISALRGLAVEAAPAVEDNRTTPGEWLPGVQEYLERHPSLSHAAALPDPSESLETVRAYAELSGDPSAVPTLKNLTTEHPNSRHAHVALATSLLAAYRSTSDSQTGHSALEAALRAAELTDKSQDVRHVGLVRQIASAIQSEQEAAQRLRTLFATRQVGYEGHLEFARLLVEVDNNQAESEFRLAMQDRPEGNLGAPVAFAEWLLRLERWDEAIDVTSLPGETSFYPGLLRGYALEKAGRFTEAKAEYDRYKPMSLSFPAPLEWQIPGSSLQRGIQFEPGDVSAQATLSCQGQVNLSWAVACESQTEPIGAQRQIAYTARTRVIRGSRTVGGNLCLGPIDNAGSTLCQKYTNVVCQAGEYAVQCVADPDPNVGLYVAACEVGNPNERDGASDDVAYAVYHGLVPDPYTAKCPGAPFTGDACATAAYCATGNTTNSDMYTPHSFRASNSALCPSPYTCFASVGQTCAVGTSFPNNCFFRVP